jgi:hypothetical protein
MELVAVAERKEIFLEGRWKVKASQSSGLNRQNLGRGLHLHLGDCRVAVNGNNIVVAGMAIPFGKGLSGAWPIRRGLELH